MSSVSLVFSPPVLSRSRCPRRQANARRPPCANRFFCCSSSFFVLASANGGLPLLFGVHDAATADGGATWASVGAAAPFSVTRQTNVLVPLYATTMNPFAAPAAYHDLGETLLPATPGGWEQLGVTPGGALAVSRNGTARSAFSGVPAPGLNVSAAAPRIFGALRLALRLAVAVTSAGVLPHPTPDGPRAPTSLLAFASTDTLRVALQGGHRRHLMQVRL